MKKIIIHMICFIAILALTCSVYEFISVDGPGIFWATLCYPVFIFVALVFEAFLVKLFGLEDLMFGEADGTVEGFKFVASRLIIQYVGNVILAALTSLLPQFNIPVKGILLIALYTMTLTTIVKFVDRLRTEDYHY